MPFELLYVRTLSVFAPRFPVAAVTKVGKQVVSVPSSATVIVVATVAVALLPVQLPELPLALPVRFAVIVPALKFPLPSRNTIVEPVFAFVAFDVTVNVPPSLLTLPLIPDPDVAPAAT